MNSARETRFPLDLVARLREDFELQSEPDALAAALIDAAAKHDVELELQQQVRASQADRPL